MSINKKYIIFVSYLFGQFLVACNLFSDHPAYHIGRYITHVNFEEGDKNQLQIWIVDFRGSDGIIERFSTDCRKKIDRIGSQPFKITSFFLGRKESGDQDSVVLGIDVDSREFFKHKIEFKTSKNDEPINCGLTVGWKRERNTMICHNNSNKFKYISMKLDDTCNTYFNEMGEKLLSEEVAH